MNSVEFAFDQICTSSQWVELSYTVHAYTDADSTLFYVEHVIRVGFAFGVLLIGQVKDKVLLILINIKIWTATPQILPLYSKNPEKKLGPDQITFFRAELFNLLCFRWKLVSYHFLGPWLQIWRQIFTISWRSNLFPDKNWQLYWKYKKNSQFLFGKNCNTFFLEFLNK